MTSWTEELSRARLHVVTGKGGTGKTTIAAALALALATGGRRVLLVEVEGRQGIAQLFDRAPLPYDEERIVSAPGGGEVRALAVDAEAALLEYLAMFYNLGFAGRTLRKMGAIEFATTLAPGLRDVLLTGKVKECVSRTDKDGRHLYDAVVLDAPPTGRVVKFLDVTKAMADLAKVGPIKGQSDGVVRLLHSGDTAVHLVTLLEEMPVRETTRRGRRARRRRPAPGRGARQPGAPAPAARPVGHRRPQVAGSTRRGCAPGWLSAGLDLPEDTIDGLVDETVEHAIRISCRAAGQELLAEIRPAHARAARADRRGGRGRAVRAGRGAGRAGCPMTSARVRRVARRSGHPRASCAAVPAASARPRRRPRWRLRAAERGRRDRRADDRPGPPPRAVARPAGAGQPPA